MKTWRVELTCANQQLGEVNIKRGRVRVRVRVRGYFKATHSHFFYTLLQ